MRIPLINIGNDNEEQYGNVALLRSYRKNMIPDTFVIDTGSPKTVIPYDKALRLQTPFNKKFSKIVCLGGMKYNAYEVNNFEFIIINEKEEMVIEPFPCVVLKPTSKKKESELGHFPIIIGTDFLRERKYNLVMNFEKKEFYLEKFKD
ncbi:hypothetical protein KAI04_03260 [Candidatus Pacearchaeota archaeon]|nr:hypothetical protein [Candidatus Pacearchaeota archaeon]